MKVSYEDNTKIDAAINEPTFHHLNEISPTCFEVASSPKTITEDLPLQIVFFVYQHAKLHMLQLYYELPNLFLSHTIFQKRVMSYQKPTTFFSLTHVFQLVKHHVVSFDRHSSLNNNVEDGNAIGTPHYFYGRRFFAM